MPLLGSMSLVLAFATALISILCLFIALRTSRKQPIKQKAGWANKFHLLGYLGVWLSALALTVSCLILLICFVGTDNTIDYVAHHRSDSSSDLALLYKISGIWAGREGSLLFWAWLISVFNALVALKSWRDLRKGKAVAAPADDSGISEDSSFAQRARLDFAALAVAQLVMLAFVSILVFDEGNRPFVAVAPEYLDSAGNLIGNAAFWGMNALLEHWAMAIHPPTLFVGYAGMTIPFAYAMAALIVNDPSKAWVERASRYTLVSWLFLGAGIGLGAVWAYVVLGWGGYWGWDPVENASLLSWVVGVALIHSMTMYRMRGSFKLWTVLCACLTFSFVVVGTFITRSGIVQSVHAFETNQVSLVLFGLLIIVPIIAGSVGIILRRASFSAKQKADDETESLFSRDVAYYLNNVVLIVCTLFLTYMTLSSALPSWMPFGGQALGATTYNAIARPVGVLYCLIIAVCPLLGWSKTGGKEFWRQARLPALAALILFAVLCFYFVTTLLPSYMQTLGAGGSAAEALLEAGPFLYYAALTLLGFLAASLLVMNSLIIVIRALAKRNFRTQTLGGFIAHMAMGVMLVGLIGSSMYVSERTGYMPYDEATDTASESFSVRNYSLSYVSNSIEDTGNDDDVLYSVTFDVEKDGVYLGQVTPSVLYVQSTGQQQLNAAVMNFPTEDLFVVYRGVNNEGAYSLDVRINPLISFVWVGFGLLMVGSAVSALGRRR